MSLTIEPISMKYRIHEAGIGRDAWGFPVAACGTRAETPYYSAHGAPVNCKKCLRKIAEGTA